MSKTFTQQLREAVERSELSRYAIYKQTGIDQGTMSQFVHGERGLSMPTIDLLVDVLGLELKPKVTPKRRRK